MKLKTILIIVGIIAVLLAVGVYTGAIGGDKLREDNR
jgi:FtsZ-interacting cell division protein ZipA